MKKTYLICAVAAVLLLCAGIAVGMNANKQKNTSEITSTQEAAPEEMEQNGEKVQDDTETVELSSAQPQQKQIEYFTAEDKEWIFQETYDNTQQLITSQGGSDAQSFEAELQDLPIYVDYFKNIFDGRVSPGINTLREEYTAWRQANYGGDTAEAPKPAETPAATEVRQNQTNSNSDSNGSSGLTVEGITTTNPFAGDVYEITPEQHQKDIEATREAVEKATGTMYAGSGSGSGSGGIRYTPTHKPSYNNGNKTAQDTTEDQKSNTTLNKPEQAEEGASSEPAA